MKKVIICSILGSLLMVGCKQADTTAAVADENQPIKVIFETDMGNDVDDALALDMLFKYQNQGVIELLGIATNNVKDGSIEYLDIMTNWYGHPETPLGVVVDGAAGDNNPNYAQTVAQMTDSVGAPVYARAHADDDFIRPAVEMYRSLLAAQPDSSVTIVSVGFSTNLSQLLNSEPDSISPLSGAELVAQKVAQLVTMGGHIADQNFCEYNIVRDVAAAQNVFANWPTTLVTSPWEVGGDILYPGSSIENDFTWAPNHPMVDGYKAYLPMPYDRPTWDLTSVLYAVEGAGNYFGVSEAGDIVVNDNGSTTFTANADGNRFYLTTTPEQKGAILARFLELIPVQE